VGCIHGLSRC